MFEGDLRPEHSESQFCRLCFNKSVDLCPLFPPDSIPNKALLHKIFDCTTITLSFRDDHNAQICSSCIVSIEAFFKYKIKCMENDKLLRKRRTNFFMGLGLTADLGSAAPTNEVQGDKEKHTDKPPSKKPDAENKSEETQNCNVKQEVIEDDDDDDYFNPDQFLAQETQIGDKQLDQAALNGTEPNNFGNSNNNFERGWKTTEFSPQPGSSGLKPLKITDYSNLTGKRGRPQKFITTVPTERLLAHPGQYPNPFHSTSPVPSRTQGFESAYRHHLSMSNGGRLPGPQQSLPVSTRYEPYPMNSLEQTRKVQKFLDDGLRDLILNSGTINPNFAVDGGYTNFRVVKARCNSYNLIFEANRFLRRNKSCSGLPKWYWACSVNNCPVKICSYKGRLYKTNDKINHVHPPTETDDKLHEIVLPDQIDEMIIQPSQPQLRYPQQQITQHSLQQQPLQTQQQPQQKQNASQLKQPQTNKTPTESLVPTKENSSQSLKTDKEILDKSEDYVIVKDTNNRDLLIYKEHKHKLIKVEPDGSKLWKCATPKENGELCGEIIQQLSNGKIKCNKTIKKEEVSEAESDELTNDDEADNSKTDDGKRKTRPPKVAVYEGYHYKYCHARPEGSLYWRCVMKQDSNCLASLHTKATYEFLNFNDQQHNHELPDPSSKPENAIICRIIPPKKVQTVPLVGSTDFQLVKSGQKREFLIYQLIDTAKT